MNATTATPGCSTSRAPTNSPGPGSSWITPGGAPAATSASTRQAAMVGVCSAGFKITVLPATRAATVIPVGMASGKFQGEMTAATPFPRYRNELASPGGESTAPPPSRRMASRP